MAVIGMMSSLRPRSANCVTPGGTFCHRGLTVAPTGFLGTPTNPQLVIRQQLIQIPRELIHRRTKPFLQFQLPDKAPSSPAQGPRSWLGGSLEVVNAWKLKPKQPQSPLQGLWLLQPTLGKVLFSLFSFWQLASCYLRCVYPLMSCQEPRRHCGRFVCCWKGQAGT